MFNAIQKMCRWTFLSNIFSVQSDCPHRERLGYGGDLVNTSDAFMLNYDMADFYAKAVRDWQDSAQPDGMLTDTSPFVGINYCGVGWAMAHPQLQLQLYQYYGDKRLMEQQYETSKRWLDLVASENPEHIVKEGLSDHEGLASAPSPDMVTPLYYQSARMLAKMSELLGRGREAQKYQDLAKEIKKAYLDKFMETQTGKFGPGTQAGQCFALYSDLVPQDQRDKAFKFLLDDIQIKHEGHLSTGIFGTKYILGLLSQEGYADVAYSIVNQKTFPGWGYMLENGATTLWEHWAFSDNTFSHNHPMFGSVSQWFFNWLGGIQPHPEAVGFDRIIIRPQIVNDLQWVKSSYNSVRGPIVSNWAKKDGYVQLDVEIPANTNATVYVPAYSVQDVREGLKQPATATKMQGISALGMEGKTAVFSVGSGKYHFVSKLPQ
jgi:alpha-L-rhamnosidase